MFNFFKKNKKKHSTDACAEIPHADLQVPPHSIWGQPTLHIDQPTREEIDMFEKLNKERAQKIREKQLKTFQQAPLYIQERILEMKRKLEVQHTISDINSVYINPSDQEVSIFHRCNTLGMFLQDHCGDMSPLRPYAYVGSTYDGRSILDTFELQELEKAHAEAACDKIIMDDDNE